MQSRAGLRVAILGVNYAPEPTGIAPYTTGLAEGLAARGHAVRVLTSYPHYPHWRVDVGVPSYSREKVGGVLVERFRHFVPSEPSPLSRLCFELAFGTRIAAQSWRLADVVISISPALLASSMAMAKTRLRRKRPAMGLVIQDIYSTGLAETGAANHSLSVAMTAIESATARTADGVAVIHDRFAAQLESNLGVPAQRIRVIRNWSHATRADGFDVCAFRRRMGWQPDELVVLHAGAMGVKQGLENVVAAAAMVEQLARPIRFVLLGDGSQRRNLERAGAGIQRLQFVNPLDDADFARALAAADMLLVNEKPGLNEMAVPSKLTSYFNAERPVLAATEANSTTATELAAAGAGIRVRPGDPRALVDGVLSLASRDDAESLGRSGGRYARDVLSHDAAIDGYDAWVRELAVQRTHTTRGTA